MEPTGKIFFRGGMTTVTILFQGAMVERKLSGGNQRRIVCVAEHQQNRTDCRGCHPNRKDFTPCQQTANRLTRRPKVRTGTVRERSLHAFPPPGLGPGAHPPISIQLWNALPLNVATSFRGGTDVAPFAHRGPAANPLLIGPLVLLSLVLVVFQGTSHQSPPEKA